MKGGNGFSLIQDAQPILISLYFFYPTCANFSAHLSISCQLGDKCGRQKTPEYLIHEVRQLQKSYPATEVVERMTHRGLPRRTTYRLLAKLKQEDEERMCELAERVRQALEREEDEQIRWARMRGGRPFRSVAQLLPRARVRAG